MNRKRILIVCGGNTCRSPMAKVILEQMLKGKGLERQFEVDSAAYRGPDGTSAHPFARETIKELYGADLLADHVPKKLTDEMAEKADLIIVMEDYMKYRLSAQKVVVLGIPDPFGPIEEKYGECAQLIQQRFEKIWPDIVGSAPLPPKTEDISSVIRSPRTVSLGTAWVYDEVFRIAEEVNYGRAEHSQTVTRLMRDMYRDLVSIGFISDSADKCKLAEIAGLSHDIGVGKEQCNEGHHAAGWRMLKKELWSEGLSADRKNPLAVVMYAVFYHRDPVPDGKLKPVKKIPLEDYRTSAELVSLLRVADGLDHGLVSGSPDKVEKVEMVRTSKGVECRVFPRHGKNVMGLLAKSYEKREVFEATFGKLTFWLPGEGASWVLWHP